MIKIENKARKIGNSLGIILPRKVVKKVNLEPGMLVEVVIKVKKKIDGFGKFKKASKFEEEKETHNF